MQKYVKYFMRQKTLVIIGFFGAKFVTFRPQHLLFLAEFFDFCLGNIAQWYA